MMKNKQSFNYVDIYTILAKMGQGKTTIGKYILEQLNKPSLIVDIADQFNENTNYRKVIKGLNELKHFLGIKYFKSIFYKSKMQIIYKFTSDDEQNEAKELFLYLNENLKDITIFCEEMELYADQYLRKNNPIFKTFYLARNKGFHIIVIAKNIGQLSPLIKDQTTIFFANTSMESAKKYLDERSDKKFSIKVKTLQDKEFIIIKNEKFYKIFKLNQNIVKKIK